MALTCVAAIGNLSEQAGIKLEKVDLIAGSISFSRKSKKSFQINFLVSSANSFLFFFIIVYLKFGMILRLCCQ